MLFKFYFVIIFIEFLLYFHYYFYVPFYFPFYFDCYVVGPRPKAQLRPFFYLFKGHFQAHFNTQAGPITAKPNKPSANSLAKPSISKKTSMHGLLRLLLSHAWPASAQPRLLRVSCMAPSSMSRNRPSGQLPSSRKATSKPPSRCMSPCMANYSSSLHVMYSGLCCQFQLRRISTPIPSQSQQSRSTPAGHALLQVDHVSCLQADPAIMPQPLLACPSMPSFRLDSLASSPLTRRITLTACFAYTPASLFYEPCWQPRRCILLAYKNP